VAKRPTIIDVAKLAGVSKATAARVLNGQSEIVRDTTQERVNEAAEKLGYVRNAIAGSLRTDRTYIITLSIPDISNPFWSEVVRGVQDTIEADDYVTVTVNTDWKQDREQRYLRMVRQNRFDGLIINPLQASLTDLEQLRIPVVILGSGDNYARLDSISSDTETGAKQGMKYLFELGHRRIGLIIGRPARSIKRSRYDTYVTFFAENSLSFDPNIIIECEFTNADGFDAMQRLLNLTKPPTAVFAANDILAIGAIKSAQAMNYRVPEDISVIGMDDIYPAAMTSPSLTTIMKSKYETGQRAAQFLLERMSKNEPVEARHIKLPCQLIKRGSTASLEDG
jgi:DNA-binding LacI/PurR family transcriptional regulator